MEINGWSEMTWQEKREERFKRWLNPIDIKFVNLAAEKLYQERVARFIKAIKIEEPDRVPVMLPTGNFPAYHAGLDLHTIMYDPEALLKAWIKFMDDFGDMDVFRGPSLPTSGKILDTLNPKTTKWPGHGLPTDVSMYQIVEDEYMLFDEYDKWITDPSDYQLRINLPRTSGLFESFRKLPLLWSLQGMQLATALSDPDIRSTFQILMNLIDDLEEWQTIIDKILRTAVERGYPVQTFGPLIGAPFDYFADLLRGTLGISMDMFRQPQKLHEAMEKYLDMVINTLIKDIPITNCPIIMMPLHKGDDAFMSDKQFEIFYWPYLRRLLLAMVNEGLVPMPFAEGKYTNRLKQIVDTPKRSIIWYFDQTDMSEAKQILGEVSCIAGNIPTSILKTATPERVKDYCRKLIETCSSGGGYILAGGASIDKGNIDNLKAMMEAAYEFGIY